MNDYEDINWFDGVEESVEYMGEHIKVQIAVAIKKAMDEKGINRTSLAKFLNTSPAYITKVLRGDANLTIESMAKFSHALDKCLHLHLTNRDFDVKWVEVISRNNYSEAKPAWDGNTPLTHTNLLDVNYA
jgi:plasmid maintenance system antidote protein VapI